MKGFFDMHCHMLFDVDDGAKDFLTSQAMLDIAYADGIRNICLTPHCNPYDKFPDTDAITTAFHKLTDFVRSKELDINLSLGSEMSFTTEQAFPKFWMLRNVHIRLATDRWLLIRNVTIAYWISRKSL